MSLRLVRALVFSDVWIGVACAAQIAYSFLLLGLEPDTNIMLFGGFATIAVYNWQRLVRVSGKLPEVHSARHRWIESNRSWLWTLMGVSLISSFYFLLQLSHNFILSVFLLSTLAFFYTLPWFSGNSRRGLRELPYLKLFLIAICWAGVTAFLPLAEEGAIGMPIIVLVSVERFFFILAITIPFDVRDLPHDNIGKKTLPQVFGIRRALNFAMDGLLISVILVVAILRTYDVHWVLWLVLLLGYGFTAYLIRSSTQEKGELHYTGVLDGMMILIPALLWGAQYLLS